jgi:heme A synthase
VQVLLGAVTVKLSLPPWTVILHLGTAMLLLATLIVAAKLTPGPTLTPGASPGISGARPSRAGLWALGLGFVTVLFGALTANLGAASACLGFPLCNGQLAPAGNYLQHVHWTHRLLAYTLFAYVVWWAVRSRRRGAWYVVALVTLQVGVAAAMVLLALPPPLQAAHVAVGTAVWAALVLAVL